MTFGDYEYGPDDQDDSDPEPEDIEYLDPDNPGSIQQCDHPNCKEPTPESRQRICEDCTEIMRPTMPDECERCGASVKGRNL